jgi:hypothetical protein
MSCVVVMVVEVGCDICRSCSVTIVTTITVVVGRWGRVGWGGQVGLDGLYSVVLRCVVHTVQDRFQSCSVHTG